MSASAADPAPASDAERRVRVLVEPITAERTARRRRRGLSVEESGIVQDAVTGEILIVAKISYIETKIAERGLLVVERRAQEPGDLDRL